MLLRTCHHTRAYLVLWAVILLLWGAPRPAFADDGTERLARQMLRAQDNKVRLSAALNLAKKGDTRAVPAFVRALRDDDESVRGVAATALGRLVSEKTSMDDRKRVLKALRRVGENEREKFVRDRARAAYRKIRKLPAPPTDAPEVYIDVGPMSDESNAGGKFRDAMRRALRSGIRDASGMEGEWPGGKPSEADIEENDARAFHVDGTLSKLSSESSGRNTVISCEVSMLIATYPDKSMFGFLSGGANVQTGSSERQIERGKRDCVVAVVENLVSSRVIPTIEERVR